MIADRSQIDARLVNDVANRHAVETAVGEQPFGGEKDPLLRIGARLGWRGRRRGLRVRLPAISFRSGLAGADELAERPPCFACLRARRRWNTRFLVFEVPPQKMLVHWRS